MISFEQFLAEGRGPSNKYSEPDIEIAKKHLTSYTNMGSVYAEVRRLYQRFTDQLLDAGIKERQLKRLDLQGLIDLAENRGIRLKAVYNRGRRELYTPTDEEMATAKKADPSLTDKEAKAQIKKQRTILMKRLLAADAKLFDLEKKNLADLNVLAKKMKLDMTAKPKRNINWDKFEKDVCAGINQLFKIGFFKTKKAGKVSPINDTKTFYAKNIGGGTKSDVQVFHEGKSDFFVECKLNFDAAEYFKFGLTINGNKLQYNHKRFLDGHSDPDEVKEIDELFKKKIDLPAVLNDIVQSSEVKKSWQQFLKNLQEVKKFLQSTKEYKNFANGLKLQSFPADFKSLTDVFDRYVNYYVTRYNKLLDEIFDMFKDDKDLQDARKKYKILMGDESKWVSQESGTENDTIKLSNILITYVDGAYPKKVFPQKDEFDTKINMLKMIEAKFEALLEKTGHKGTDYAALSEFENDEKLMYFFKMFISSAGRRIKGQDLNSLVQLDELGNMQICSSITLKTKKMAEAITNYYVGHGKCAYIQVLDRVYQFDEKINPFGIKKLPIFKDVLDVYNIRISVTDDLSDIRLHVKSIQPDKSMLSKYSDISFIQSASNYVQKILKNIVVTVS